VKFTKHIYSKKPLAVLDFGPKSARVLIAEKKADGNFDILGAGDTAAQGMKDGEFAHLGDAVECVVEAVRKAERSSGLAIQRLYYNFDDPGMEGVWSRGGKSLSGEGEIRRQDVEDARKTAERLVGHFEKNIVYSKVISSVIDGRDAVEDPVGVFGRNLEVSAYILLARSKHCEAWWKLFERAHLERGVPVISAWSAALGVLNKENRQKKSAVFDIDFDFLNALVFINDKISDSRTILTQELSAQKVGERVMEWLKEFTAQDAELESVWVTGELSENEKILSQVRNSVGLPVERGVPLGVSRIHEPRFSSIAGLIHAADEMEKRIPILDRDKGIFVNVKERTLSFLNEYF